MRLIAAATALALGAAISLHAQSDDPVATLVAKATAYVAQYERDFSGVVGELHETQRQVKPDGTVRRERQLVCDVLLVKIGEATQSFRDVLSVDGRPVRNRDERLRKLFISGSRTAAEQARAIAREGSRHDLTGIHVFDTLMLPLRIVGPTLSSRFRFEASDDGLAFTEVKSPSLFRSRGMFSDRQKDMLITGSLTLDHDVAAVRAGTLRAASDDGALAVSIRYMDDPVVHLLVPSEVKESLRPNNAKSNHVEVTGTYSNFRRFQVTTREEVSSDPAARPDR